MTARATWSALTTRRISPTRPGAVPASTCSRNFVSTMPGQTFRTLIPVPNSSRCNESSMQWSAHLVAQYMTAQGNDTFPPTDPMLTMAPDCCARIWGTTSCVNASAEKTFTSKMRLEISVSTSVGYPYWPAPALLMSTSMRPKWPIVRSTTSIRVCFEVMSPVMTSREAASSLRNSSLGSAVKASLAPRWPNSLAQLAPIPSEAPVIRTTFLVHTPAECKLGCIESLSPSPSSSPSLHLAASREDLPENFPIAMQRLAYEPEFPFCIPGDDSIPPVVAAAILSAFIPEPKNRARPSEY